MAGSMVGVYLALYEEAAFQVGWDVFCLQECMRFLFSPHSHLYSLWLILLISATVTGMLIISHLHFSHDK